MKRFIIKGLLGLVLFAALILCYYNPLKSMFIFSESKAHAAVKFELREIIISNIKINVEMADSVEQQKIGLMNRTELGENSGMLFTYENEKVLHFWMKNTFIPLSIGFFDKHKKLVEIQQMRPVTSVMDSDIPQYKSRVPAKYALEMNQGWFKKNKIKPGTFFKFTKNEPLKAK